MKHVFLLLTLIIWSNLTFAVDNCQKIQAALDIGSGATKLKVAKVDICTHKIIEYLVDTNEKVLLKEDLNRSTNQSFSSEIVQKEIQAITKLVDIAKKFNASKIKAVATSAFRTATNSQIIVDQIRKKINIIIKIISNKEEAILGHKAALSLSKYNPKNTIVWDIGGGSMQMTSVDNKNNYQTYLGKIASAGFKDNIISLIQKKNIKEITSPNPITEKEADKAVIMAEDISKNVTSSIKAKLQMNNIKVIGIGGVHYYSLRNQINNDSKFYTIDELATTTQKRVGLTDKQINSDYAATDISNMLLVLGFMKNLKIKEVHVMNINLADGLLVD